MTDVHTETGNPSKRPARKAKRRRPKAKAAAANAPVANGEFSGMSAHNCASQCFADKRCCITAPGSGICGHPLKGGLQQGDMLNSAVVARFKRAKKLLQHAKIDATQ